MLFLVFDIELVLLLPISVSLYAISTFGFVVAIIFFIILTIGFIFEIGNEVITLKSSSITNNSNLNLNLNLNYNNQKENNNNLTPIHIQKLSLIIINQFINL